MPTQGCPTPVPWEDKDWDPHFYVPRARTPGSEPVLHAASHGGQGALKRSPTLAQDPSSSMLVSLSVSHACPRAGPVVWGWAEGAHQGSFQARGVVVASPHDQERPLRVELQGQVVDLLVQRQHFLDEL